MTWMEAFMVKPALYRANSMSHEPIGNKRGVFVGSGEEVFGLIAADGGIEPCARAPPHRDPHGTRRPNDPDLATFADAFITRLGPRVDDETRRRAITSISNPGYERVSQRAP
jgi:hypothetical protein